MAERPFNVLFLCRGNSARSIMAEASLSRWGRDKFQPYSAGSQPRGELHPMTRRVLERFKFDPAQFRSKDWSEFAGPAAPPLDFVFTVCDQTKNEPCPVWPGQPMTAHWGIEDPVQFEGDEERTYNYFVRVYTYLDNRIKIFTALPFASLSKLSLQNRLDEIGRVRDETPADEPPR
jgi:arsenate reductase